MDTLSIRDIIGPIMVGPSSSHTAGALRIAYMARRLCLAEPRSVEFSLLGSFAHTLVGHGTDKALVGGMLGLDTDDLRIRDSFQLAREAGLAFSFTPERAGTYELLARAVRADGSTSPEPARTTIVVESGC